MSSANDSLSDNGSRLTSAFIPSVCPDTLPISLVFSFYTYFSIRLRQTAKQNERRERDLERLRKDIEEERRQRLRAEESVQQLRADLLAGDERNQKKDSLMQVVEKTCTFSCNFVPTRTMISYAFVLRVVIQVDTNRSVNWKRSGQRSKGSGSFVRIPY
jgi:hypothetical protein